MTESIALNNQQHEQNISCLANAIPAIQAGHRVEACAILLTFRHHESQRRRARQSCGIDVPSPHESRQRAILWALKALIVSRQAHPEEAIS